MHEVGAAKTEAGDIGGLTRPQKLAVFVVAFAVIVTAFSLVAVPHPAAFWGGATITAGNDSSLLLNYLRPVHTLKDTLVFWTTGFAGVQYWRPLASFVFWIQLRAFGLHRFDHWVDVSAVLYVLCSALLGWLLWRLGGLKAALVGVVLFAVMRPYISWLGLDMLIPQPQMPPDGMYTTRLWVETPVMPPNAISLFWTDQHDLWADCLIFSCLIATTYRRWWAALICALVAVCFKESGYLTFVLALVVAAYRGDVRTIPSAPIIFAVASIGALVIVRHYVKGHMSDPAHLGQLGSVMTGMQTGSNPHWFCKYLWATAGNFVNVFVTRPGDAITSIGLLLLALSRRRKLMAAGFAIAVAGMVVEAAWLNTSLATRLPLYYDWGSICPNPAVAPPFSLAVEIPIIAGSFIWLFGAAMVWRSQHKSFALFMAALSFIASTMFVLAVQIQCHALHLAFAFQSAFVATMLIATYDSLRFNLTTAQNKPSETVIQQTGH